MNRRNPPTEREKQALEYYKTHSIPQTCEEFSITPGRLQLICRYMDYKKDAAALALTKSKPPITKRRFNYDVTRFSDVVNLGNEECYWLGFLYADGCISRGKGITRSTLSLAIHEKDHDHAVAFKGFMGYEGSMGKTEKRSMVTIGCEPQLTHNLALLGIVERKTHNGFYPAFALDTEEKRLCWALGLFDGDGTISSDGKGRVTIYCQLEEVLVAVANAVGIESAPGKHRKDAEYFSLRFRVAESESFLSRAYECSPISLVRKKTLFMEAKEARLKRLMEKAERDEALADAIAQKKSIREQRQAIRELAAARPDFTGPKRWPPGRLPVKWKTEGMEAKIIAEYQSGKSARRVARDLGLSGGHVAKIIQDAGVELRDKSSAMLIAAQSRSKTDYSFLLPYAQEGLSSRKIAALTGVPKSVVASQLKKMRN